MIYLFCRVCVRIVSWINGVIFGCAEDAVDLLDKFGDDAEAGFEAGVGAETELRSRIKLRKRPNHLHRQRIIEK